MNGVEIFAFGLAFGYGAAVGESTIRACLALIPARCKGCGRFGGPCSRPRCRLVLRRRA